MKRARNTLLQRRDAYAATQARFLGRPFTWYQADCARLAAKPLQLLGYKPNFSRFGVYRTDLGARKALAQQGFSDTVDWMDSIHGLYRTDPARALPCDILAYEGEGGWTALSVYAGNGAILAFRQDTPEHECAVLRPDKLPLAVWSATPCRS